jgi:uncharacterized HAD superfamily protein
MRTKVLLDIDGVLANFVASFFKYLNENYGCNLNVKKEPNEYEMSKWNTGLTDKELSDASFNWIINNGFLQLSAYPGAGKFAQELAKKYDVYLVTARIGDWDERFSKEVKDLIKEDTRKWLEVHGIPADNLFFVHKKADFCKKYGINILVEDKASTVIDAVKNGIVCFLVDRAWNKLPGKIKGAYRVKDFDEILNVLGKINK